MKYKPAEKYKADFQKVSLRWAAKVFATVASLGLVVAWFIYWTWVA